MSEYNMSHTGRELDDAINKVRSGYVLPTEVINIVSNVSNKDITNGKVLNVNVPIPDGYIKIADTWNYTTRFAHGTYKPATDTLVSNISINDVGFKPKVFFLRSQTSVQSNSSRYYLTTSVMVVDNNYDFAIVQPDGSISTRTAIGSGLYLTSSKAASVQSNGEQNVFHPTTNGVAGNGATSSSLYAKANVQYFWFAWG